MYGMLYCRLTEISEMAGSWCSTFRELLDFEEGV